MVPPYRPMRPSLVAPPFHRAGWIYERKEDGWRMLAYKDGARVRLVSRQGVDHTARFPELAAAVAALPGRGLVLDGEVCVFDADLVSQFHLLTRERADVLVTPPVYVAFDLLHAGGRALVARPLADRRAALESLIAGASLVLPALRLPPDGVAAWEEVKRHGWEGLVAKDPTSRYTGGPTRAWLKVKVRRESRFVVVGVDAPLTGASALRLAARRGSRLVGVGRVEWGVTRAVVAAVRARAPERATPACEGPRAGGRGGVWIEPRLWAEVTYSELMDGTLRDPVVRRIGPL